MSEIIRFYMLDYIVFSWFGSSYFTSRTLGIKFSDIFLNIVPIVCRFLIFLKLGLLLDGSHAKYDFDILSLLPLILMKLYTILHSNSFSLWWITSGFFLIRFSIILFIFRPPLFYSFSLFSFGILILKVN